MSAFNSLIKGDLAIKLPLGFNPALLVKELQKIKGRWWKPHSEYGHDGSWEDVMLRKKRDTAPLRACPYFRAAMDRFPGERALAYLSRLKAGGAIARHTDPFLRQGKRDLIPVHIPITTNPSVYFLVNRQRIVMKPGEAWCINTYIPHEVYNLGKEDRVYLILHFFYSRALESLIGRGSPVAAAPESDLKNEAVLAARRYLERISSPAGKPPPRNRPSTRRGRLSAVAQILYQSAGFNFQDDRFLHDDPHPTLSLHGEGMKESP